MIKSIFLISLVTTLSAYAQISPLQNYQSTVITYDEGKQVWNAMRTDFISDSECFNRAMSWTYDINKLFGYEAKKILIHYSYKYNQELSSQWGFHIAPVYNVEGHDFVFDKGFEPWIHAPITPQMWEEKFLEGGTAKLVEKRIKLQDRINQLKYEIEHMDISSSLYPDSLLSKRNKISDIQAEMVEFGITDADLQKQRPLKIEKVKRWIKYFEGELNKYRQSTKTYQTIQWQLKKQKELLGKVMNDFNYSVHLQCKRITHIEELDYNKNGAWCFTQQVSQYYWGVPQLRLLNYGPGHGMNTLPVLDDLPAARKEGENFVKLGFDMHEVWAARKEAFGSNYRHIWATEYDLKKASASAVRNIHRIVNEMNQKRREAEKTYGNILEIVNQSPSQLHELAVKAKLFLSKIQENSDLVREMQAKIYQIKHDITVLATKEKADHYDLAEDSLNKSNHDNKQLKTIYHQAKKKLKAMLKNERER